MNEKPEEIWSSRNPTHELNADTGKDMFMGTVVLCMVEYAEQQAIEFAQWAQSNGYFIAGNFEHLYSVFINQTK